jgi:hypothetical protein
MIHKKTGESEDGRVWDDTTVFGLHAMMCGQVSQLHLAAHQVHGIILASAHSVQGVLVQAAHLCNAAKQLGLLSSTLSWRDMDYILQFQKCDKVFVGEAPKTAKQFRYQYGVIFDSLLVGETDTKSEIEFMSER